MSVFDIDPLRAFWNGSVIVAAEEPSVKPVEVIARIPGAWIDEPDRYGSPDEIIRYLAKTNRVPDHVSVEFDRDTDTRDVRVRFYWWEITALVPREERRA